MKILWFGIYKGEFGRNKIYMSGLRKLGHDVLECREDSPGISKYFRLRRKLKSFKDDYDFIVIGYPGHVVVPIAKFASKKPVIADLLGSLYDAEKNSHKPGFFRLIKSRVADYLAIKFADKVLLESEAQKKYFEERFGKSEKFHVVYTGADEIFSSHAKRSTLNAPRFTVLFRGSLTPESGIMYILEAANLLRWNKGIGDSPSHSFGIPSIGMPVTFRVIGKGQLLEQVKLKIENLKLENVELISEYLEPKELVEKMIDADLMLGQFEDNPRLNRTIPHKAFEAFALGIPYLSGDAPAVREIVRDGETGFLVPLANPKAIADKITYLSNNRNLLKKVSENETKDFNNKFTGPKLVSKIIDLIHK